MSFYHVKRSSLFSWLNKLDGSKKSLIDKSHKPLSPHPKTILEEIVQKTINIKRRNPNSLYMEIWLKMHRNGYSVSLSSVLRILKRAKNMFHMLVMLKRNIIKNITLPL